MVMLFHHLEQPSPIGSTQITSCSTASVLLQQFHFGHTIDMANSRNTVNVPLIGLFAKRLCEDFFSVLGNTV